MQIRYEDEDEDEGPQPDQTLEQGLPLPVRLHGSFPPELSSTPLEDIDPFYSNQRVIFYRYLHSFKKKKTIISLLRNRHNKLSKYFRLTQNQIVRLDDADCL